MPLWWRDACGVFVWSSMLVVVALWVAGGGVHDLAQTGTGLTSIGRLTGLVASDLLLIQVLLMARIPLVEMAYGQDELARRHRWVGFWSFNLMLVHIVAITLGYAATSPKGLWATIVDFVVNYPGMLLALAGTVALVGVTITSIKAGPGPAALRVLAPASSVRLPRRGAGAAAPALDRQGVPDLNGRHGVLVDPVGGGRRQRAHLAGRPAVVAQSASSAGRGGGARRERPGHHGRHGRADAERLPVRAGQFLQWRFLDGPGFTGLTPTPCPRHRTAGRCGSPPPTWGMGRPGWRAFARGRGCSSKAPTAGCTRGCGPVARSC